MVLPITGAQVERAQRIIRQVVELQRELLELGLPATSARMAAVNDRIGWELAERMMEASGFVVKEKKKRQQRHSKFDSDISLNG